MIYVTKPVLPDRRELDVYLDEIWERSWLTNDGPMVQEFERELGRYLGGERRVVAVTNGTLALQLVFKAMGLEGEVVTTPFTFSATRNALEWEGLKPVYADIDPGTFCIDPGAVEAAITPRTSAILGVHVYGNPCYTGDLEQVAERHGLALLFDAAHAFGVEYQGKPITSWGDASTLSFHATKVFNTFEGGAVVCRTNGPGGEVALLRNHGIISEGGYLPPGTNAKMDELRAAVGLCNLGTIDLCIAERETIYKRYLVALGSALQFQKLIAFRYNYAYAPVCFADKESRDYAYVWLRQAGVGVRKYFYPLVAEAPGCPVARDVSERVLCLPIYPGLGEADQDMIIEIVKGVVE